MNGLQYAIGNFALNYFCNLNFNSLKVKFGFISRLVFKCSMPNKNMIMDTKLHPINHLHISNQAK